MQMKAPLSFAKKEFKRMAYEEWDDDWRISDHYRENKWTARIFPSIEHRKKAGRLPLSFNYTQFIADHGKFSVYLTKRHVRTNPNCVCGQPQDCGHLLFECIHTRTWRLELEGECDRLGINYTIETLHEILGKPTLHPHIIDTFNKIHRLLVDWERSGLLY